MSESYVVITAARDEEEHIEQTLRSMIAQTITPQRWIIVNDGSTDQTGVIAERYARRHPWITVVNRPNRGTRKNGGGVVEAFYDGFRQLEEVDWDYIVKLDGDLSFGPNYFERCFEEFARDPHLGIAGGALYNVTPTGPQFEAHPLFHVRGATKIYRELCWRSIGGIWSGPGWDTIDEVKANMNGWRTRTLTSIHAYHHRMTGAAEGGWRDNLKNGRGNYAAGYHPLFVMARCAHRIRRKPYVVGSLAMMYGFVSAHWSSFRRVDDPRLIGYIRRQQLNKLLGRPTVWK